MSPIWKATHTASPDSQGVLSGAILQFLTELDRLDVDLHSLYIFRNGFSTAGCQPPSLSGRHPPAHLFRCQGPHRPSCSVRHSGRTGLTEDTPDSAFPEDLPETVTPRMESITVYHLLTMTTGHDRDTFRPVLNSTNSVRAFLEGASGL